MVHRVRNPETAKFGSLEVLDVDPLRHVLLDEEPEFVGWQDYTQFLTVEDVQRLQLYIATFRELAGVPGDIVEIGVFRGGNLKLLSLAAEVAEPGGVRNLVGFDTFEGFPRQQLRRPQEQRKAAVYDTPDNLGAAVAKLAHQKRATRFVIGDVIETFGPFYETWGNRIALAYLDVDLLDASRSALGVLAAHLSLGGRVLLDQYSRDGWSETQAVDEFLREQPGVFELSRIPGIRAPSAMLTKRGEPGAA